MTPTLSPPRAASASPVARRLGDALTMFLVTGLSLLLLVYVGFGEAKRTYGQLHIEQISAQAGFVRNSMESYLRRGLPMRQYVGFATLTEPIVESEEIAAIIAYDQSGREVFRNVEKNGPKNLEAPPGIERVSGQVAVHLTAEYYQVILPLHSRFETVGSLVVTSRTSAVDRRVREGFEPMLIVALLLSVGFAAFVTATRHWLARARLPWLQIGYAVTFLSMASLVVWTLVSLYSEGVQGKARALAHTLGQRVNEIVEFRLSLSDLDGLDRMLTDYQRLNPDISAAALIVDGQVHMHTSPERAEKPWTADSRSYEYIVQLGRPGENIVIETAVAVPRNLVYRQVARSAKNFLALFVASAFLAGLFLQVAASLQRIHQNVDEAARLPMPVTAEEAALGIVKPLFFVAVFLEHMTYSFLPQYVQHAATAAGLSAGFVAVPFMAYYLFFALSLIPSGHLAGDVGARPLMCAGLGLAGVGLLALVLPVDFWGIIVARIASGIGQGMLFIGVQSYILATASAAKRTQANAIIVFGFQGGMISGMAIGSLLVTYMGPAGVFQLAGVLAGTMAAYGLAVIPDTRSVDGPVSQFGNSFRRLFGDVSAVLRDGQFIRTMLFVGMPAKAALTGVITFALPLLLAMAQYKQEDIGQIIMFYAIGVVVASQYVSRLVDRSGRTSRFLFFGTAIAGVGMLAMGLWPWTASGDGVSSTVPPTVVVMAGIIVIGIAHGFVNAPVVTHVATLGLAKRIGIDSATATYRFLERVGHIAGPILVGQMFLVVGMEPVVVAWFGAATLFLAFLFLAASQREDSQKNPMTRVA